MRLVANGLTFEAQAAGEPGAPLVLMLHGFPQTSHTWRHQLEPLAEAGFHAVAPDQRGYSPGARPPAVAEYATERLVADALAMIETLGHDRAHVVGHDWGGQLAWLLAAHHPAHVASVAVLSRPHPQAFLAAFAKDAAQKERSRHHRAFQDPDTAERLLADDAARLRGFYHGVPGADIDAYLRVLGERDALDAAINWYRAPVQAGADSPLAPAATPAIEVPTLYIWGDADQTVGQVAATGTGAHVNAPYRFEVLPGIGHFITDEAGAEVTALLLEFLNT